MDVTCTRIRKKQHGLVIARYSRSTKLFYFMFLAVALVGGENGDAVYGRVTAKNTISSAMNTYFAFSVLEVQQTRSWLYF